MTLDRPPRGAHALLLVLALMFATPLVWMVLTSLKTPEELTANPHRALPEEWRVRNYVDAVQASPYFLQMRNSLVLAGGSVLGTLFSCSLAAYAFARLRWPGRDFLFGVLLATMLLPWHVTMIPRFVLLSRLGLHDTLAALIVPTFFGQAFSIFLLRQFFLGIPEELSEAARLDGASEPRILWQIILPLSRPALAAVALLEFIAAWNDFSGPLLFLSDPLRFPLAYGLEQFQSAYGSQTNLLMAAAVLFTAPTVVLFLLAQRTFIRGIATTGLKG